MSKAQTEVNPLDLAPVQAPAAPVQAPVDPEKEDLKARLAALEAQVKAVHQSKLPIVSKAQTLKLNDGTIRVDH